jgi:hypothetical protein
MLHETDVGIVCRSIHIFQSVVVFVIFNLESPDFIILMYHLELTLNPYEMISHSKKVGGGMGKPFIKSDNEFGWGVIIYW